MLALAVLLAAAVAAEGALESGNLLDNAGFDADMRRWVEVRQGDGRPPGAVATRISEDSGGVRSSGSLELRTSATHWRNTFAVGHCVELPKRAEEVFYGGRIRVPASQPAAGTADILLEISPQPGCVRAVGSGSGVGPIGLSDEWSERKERTSVSQARSARLLATVTKRYVWADEDQTGERDDGVLFRAQFDDLFVRVASEKPQRERERNTRSSSAPFADAAPPAAKLWGPLLIQPPTLQITAASPDGSSSRSAPEYDGLRPIGLAVVLRSPYDFEDPRHYPVQELSIATVDDPQDLVKRPTVEVVVYRGDDPSRKPLDALVSSSGGGVIYQERQLHLSLQIRGGREHQLRSLRRFLECMEAHSAKSGLPGVPPMTDDELLATPLATYRIESPAGEYEVLARYLALESGLWHEPIVAAPFRFRVREAEARCSSKPAGGAP